MSRAFSLLEVLLASVIFLIGVAAVSSSLTASSVAGARGLHVETARDIARTRIEELLATPTGADAIALGGHEEHRNQSGALDAGGLYTVQWTVTPHPSVAVLQIALNVSWTEGGGTETVSMETMR